MPRCLDGVEPNEQEVIYLLVKVMRTLTGEAPSDPLVAPSDRVCVFIDIGADRYGLNRHFNYKESS